jgi:hypothetical protein
MPVKKSILTLLGIATLLLVAGTWCAPFMGLRESIPFESLSAWPDGTPRLKPFEIKMDRESDAIRLAHRLAFDGERYCSELYMPIIASYVLQREDNVYEWRDMDDRVSLLQNNPPDKDGTWTLETIDENTILITGAGDAGRYVYSGGKLSEVDHNGLQRKFFYKDEQLTGIATVRPGKQSYLEFNYNQQGLIDTISNTPGNSVTISRNAAGMLAGIKGAHGVDMAFTYADGLLTGASCDGKTLGWKWGTARIKHQRPHLPPPPIISSDGANEYEVTYDGNLIKVRWSPKEGGPGKGWDYLPVAGRIKARVF